MKISTRKLAIGAAVLTAGVLSANHQARAAAFTAGDLVVYRVGDGTTGLVNTGSAVFLDEYTTTGTLVQSVAVASTGANALVSSGTATSEGLLNYNNGYLTLTGYNRAVGGTSSLSGTTGTAVPRIVDVYGTDGNVASTTKLTDFASGNNPRSAYTTDNTTLFVGGGAGGLRTATVGNTTSAQINTTANVRDVNTYGGTTYFSTSSGTTGIYSASAGTQTMIVASVSPYQFAFAQLSASSGGADTLYVADDSANAIEKFSLVSGTWTATGTITATAVRGLTINVMSNGTVQLFGATGGSAATGGGTIYAATDTTGFDGTISGTTTSIATATTNEAIRGIAFIPTPVPEPATWLAGGLCVLDARLGRASPGVRRAVRLTPLPPVRGSSWGWQPSLAAFVRPPRGKLSIPRRCRDYT